MSINNTRSNLYRTARFLGDVQAVRRGPQAIIKRSLRKALLRAFGRGVNRI